MRTIVPACALLFAAMPCATILAAPARITVHIDRVIGPVNQRILGNNMLAYQDSRDEYANRGAGVWDPEHHRPEPVYTRLARQAGISVARWPGGCGAHNYNWKLTVGPLAKRPEQQFGLPEFLSYCEAIGAEPLLTIAVYWGAASDAADLVEYLNAANDGSNPNGGTDWAAIRAADGHPRPYHVVWFEYGNESYHGEHHPTGDRAVKRKFTPEEYARRYLEYRAAMHAVDANIQLGALVQHGQQTWNETVLRVAGGQMDFGIEHTYLPGHKGDVTEAESLPFMQACVACTPQLQRIYEQLNQLAESITGRTDIEWAITEYNAWFVLSKPVAYRQSLGAALRNAEHLRVMMRPRNRILMANFWQFANEYWGMVRGYIHKGERVVKQANFFVFQLYHELFGDTLIAAEVTCNHWDFAGAAGVRARAGAPSEFRLHEKNLLLPDFTWQLSNNPNVKQRLDGQTVIADFSGPDTNYYHAQLKLPAKPNTGYRVTGEIKTAGLKSIRGAGFQVGDARGYTVTKSATTAGDVMGDSDWTTVVVDYVTLSDTDAIVIMTRRLGHDGGAAPIRGTAYYRLRSVQEFQPENLGGVPEVTVNAARRKDGAIALMLVNTNLEADVPANIRVDGSSAQSATARSLVGSSPWATNLGPKPEVWLTDTPVTRVGDGWTVTLPRHSLTAVVLGP